jgi:TonB family protein
MLQSTPTRRATTTWVDGVYADKQRRRLVIAIALLLAAIAAFLVRDYESGLRNDNEIATADSDQSVYAPSKAGPPPVVPVAEAKIPVETNQSAEATPVHAHSKPRLGSASVKHESVRGESASARPSATWGPATTAAKRTSTSDLAQAHQQPQPAYPLLTQATAVQGAVLMQALIAADGSVEEMRVISGPTILVSAARQAVQQWKFKPYLLNGKPVETYARVTVNFTIDVSNTEARYHVNSVTSSGAL